MNKIPYMLKSKWIDSKICLQKCLQAIFVVCEGSKLHIIVT